MAGEVSHCGYAGGSGETNGAISIAMTVPVRPVHTMTHVESDASADTLGKDQCRQLRWDCLVQEECHDPERMARKILCLNSGRLMNMDVTYVNGTRIGTMNERLLEQENGSILFRHHHRQRISTDRRARD